MGLTSRPIDSPDREPRRESVPPAPVAAPAATTPLAGHDPLAWLLHPVTVDDFRRDYYEKRVLVVPRGMPDYYRDLLGLADLDEVMGTHSLRYPELNAVGFGREIKQDEFTSEGFVDAPRAARLFAEGATLIFGQLHTRLPRLAELCLALNRAFSSRVQTNIYLTPPREQGFAPHWDTHDTIILQVSGTKQWEIYDTKFELALRAQGFEAKNPEHAPGPVTMSFELRPGDVLYVPRGVMHAAKTTDQTSLHVTVGVVAYTWADLLVEGTAQAAAASVKLRENLPWGFEHDYPREQMRALLREKLDILLAHLEGAAPIDAFADKLRTENRDLPRNLLQQVEGLGELHEDSRVRTRPDVVWRFERDESSCSLVCGRRKVTLPDFTEPALLHVMGTPSFVVRELPDCLDGEGKVTLVRRLVREGFLECVDSRPA